MCASCGSIGRRRCSSIRAAARARVRRQLARCEASEPCDQPIAWKVRQFVLWMIYVARGSQGNPEIELTPKEAKRWKQGQVAKAKSGQKEVARESHDDDEDDVELRIDGAAAPARLPPMSLA